MIPGFGYALMDIFENQYVDMESIMKAKDTIEEAKSPFKSPKKSRMSSISPTRVGGPQASVGSNQKEEMRRTRRMEKQSILDEFERREREPPKQYQLL